MSATHSPHLRLFESSSSSNRPITSADPPLHATSPPLDDLIDPNRTPLPLTLPPELPPPPPKLLVPGDAPSPSLPTPTCSDDLLRPVPYPSLSKDARNISFICFNFSSTSGSRVSISPAQINDELLACASAASRKSDAHPDIYSLTTTVICVTQVEPNATIATLTRKTARRATRQSTDLPVVDFVVGRYCQKRGRPSALAVTATATLPVKYHAFDSSHTQSCSIAGPPPATALPAPPVFPALPSTPVPTPPPPDLRGEYRCPNLLLYRPLPILGDVKVLTFVIILGLVFVFALSLAIHIPRPGRWTFHQTAETVVSETNLPAKLQDR
ncbi:hypothetical protein EDD17DRAFT_1749043 [Pisolithus thermaeus]|nr:hypothetical protein EDD17DRAFT_1749043 [Pisolithus thermaeus]